VELLLFLVMFLCMLVLFFRHKLPSIQVLVLLSFSLIVRYPTGLIKDIEQVGLEPSFYFVNRIND